MLNWVYGYAILLRTERRNEIVVFGTDGKAGFFFQYLHKVGELPERERVGERREKSAVAGDKK